MDETARLVIIAAMGILQNLRAKFSNAHADRIEKAADQIFSALCAGATLDITPSLSTEDDTSQALQRLMEKYRGKCSFEGCDE